jgi:hypothetical protein
MNIEELNLGNINFEVHTTSGRGHTPEELADMALDKIMYVSKDANPLIRIKQKLLRATLDKC